MNARLLLIVLITIVLIGIIWGLQAQFPSGGPSISTSRPAQALDTTAAITAELNQVQLGELDNEFKAIDADLNTL